MKRFLCSPRFGLLLLLLLLRLSSSYGQAWLSNDQKNPIPGQTRIFYNACTDERAFVSGNTKKWATSAVRMGQQVTLQLIGVNPFYKQTIKFEKASLSWKTPEPEKFQWVTMPASPGTDTKKPTTEVASGDFSGRLSMIVGGTGSETRKVTGARGLVKNQLNALKAVRVTAGNRAAIHNDTTFLNLLLTEADRIEGEAVSYETALATAQSQVSDAFGMVESMVSFQNSLTVSPCKTLEQYTQEEKEKLNILATYLGDASVINDAGTLANAFRHKIEVFPTMHDFVKRQKARLQTEVDNLRAQIESLTADTSKTAAEALVNEMDTVISLLSDDLTGKQAAVDSLRSQLAGEEGKKLMRACQTLLNNKTYFTNPVVLGPFSPDHNANEITVVATAIRPAVDGKGESESFSLIDLKLPVVNNIQIDFTTGGLFSTLADEAFVVRTTPSSTTATSEENMYAIQTNKNRGGFVLATQANLIWQTSPSFGWGANVGIGVDVVNNQSARYMTGLCAKFGGLSDDIILSAGAIFGKVKRLSAELSPDISYPKQIEPKTYDKFEAGFYVGISYILGSKKIKK